ncbi:MAG: phosphatidate cytidylyltransferase [Paracoccaceae bacterium]
MTDGRWSDLTARVVSALALVIVAGIAVWSGGIWFQAFVAISCGAMTWELARMLDPAKPGLNVQLGALMGGALLLAAFLPSTFLLPVALAPAVVGATMLQQRKKMFLLFAAWISVSGLAFVWLRDGQGLIWVLWLICVVVATDVAGYFAGKTIGGPKFWPAVSPKKTWSGTAAGWIIAALVGAAFIPDLEAGFGLIVVSALASVASQAGDILESALKRRVGVKDSSNLIPGHGGFLDRFDGMMGAAALVMILSLIFSGGA